MKLFDNNNNKYFIILLALERQLKKETRRRAKAEKMLSQSETNVRMTTEKIKERDRQLSVLNIYAQRNKKGTR